MKLLSRTRTRTKKKLFSLVDETYTDKEHGGRDPFTG